MSEVAEEQTSHLAVDLSQRVVKGGGLLKKGGLGLAINPGVTAAAAVGGGGPVLRARK